MVGIDGKSRPSVFVNYAGDYDRGYRHYDDYRVEDGYNYGGDNNDGLDYQMFGVLSLVLGVILFCVVWLIACVCGGVSGYFIHSQVDKQRNKAVEYSRMEIDEENHS